MGIDFSQRHRILREVYRHYIDFKDFSARTGQYFISSGPITLSLFDLDTALDTLSPRKKQAVILNVLHDLKQRDVAEIMGITTVSVGQYVESAFQQLAEVYFVEMDEVEILAYADTFLPETDKDHDMGQTPVHSRPS